MSELLPTSPQLPSLDPLLHQPARTQIVAFLSGRGEASFSELKRVLGITDGNLGAHMARLLEAGLVESRGTEDGPRVQTVFTLTASGRQALAEYVRHLSVLVKMSTGDNQIGPAPAVLRPG
ncbi:MAG TPA: transcriptional regulator [Accumulibacter sp.]|jgi:DNA-binding MarR family transcriptional regulator|nr:transcriptional regulator [Accumulibacter sp.]